ncbi:MAG TPA: AAA family ATPase [Dehalococcoidia bacterium]|nr:AAA family ATPase [Dehalococcoidia bacterium]
MEDLGGPLLIIFGGLPGAGKTTVARQLARQIGAVHVRIDTIEQALVASGLINGPVNDAGYRVGHAVAEDNLRLGRIVIADSVNPLAISRDAWRAVAERAGGRALEVEFVCTNREEHRRRVETRTSDIADLRLPAWSDVQAREYEPWNRSHLVIDTGVTTVEESAALVLRAI